MAEYIEREALIQKYRSEIEKMREYAINTPNGDVVEVRHGQYISTGYYELYCEFGDCSICGADMPRGSDYCPNCGTRMDGGNGNETD